MANGNVLQSHLTSVVWWRQLQQRSVARFHPQNVQSDSHLSYTVIIHHLKQNFLNCFGLMENKTEMASEKSYEK